MILFSLPFPHRQQKALVIIIIIMNLRSFRVLSWRPVQASAHFLNQISLTPHHIKTCRSVFELLNMTPQLEDPEVQPMAPRIRQFYTTPIYRRTQPGKQRKNAGPVILPRVPSSVRPEHGRRRCLLAQIDDLLAEVEDHTREVERRGQVLRATGAKERIAAFYGQREVGRGDLRGDDR